MRILIGCPHISDLPVHQDEVVQKLDSMDLSGYTEKQINDLKEYLSADKKHYKGGFIHNRFKKT